MRKLTFVILIGLLLPGALLAQAPAAQAGKVEKLFGIKVAAVRTQIGHGKFKRQGRFEGQRPDRKKAWVRLKAGEKAPDFIEGT